MVRAEVDILDNVTAYAAIGLQEFEYNQNLISPAWITGADGSFQQYTTWERLRFRSLAANAGIRATATTGPIDHALNLQVSGSRFSHFQSLSYGPDLDRGTIYDPVVTPMPSLTDPGDPLKVVETESFSIGIADTMSFMDDRVQFTAGLRYQKVDVATFDYDWGSAETATYESDAWSPAFGLVVKPWENVSLYANYIQGLQPGMTVSSFFANAGEVFPPYVSKQYEAGVKVDWGRVRTTLAAFQIAQPNVLYTYDAKTDLYTAALNGEQRNRGIELNAYGEIVDGVRLLSGVTFLEAVQTKTADGAFDGKRARGAPRVRAVVGGEWDTPFLEGLTLSGRLTYTSNQTVDNTTPDLTIPSWTTVDLGARYSFDSRWSEKPVTVRFDVENVFDKSYWVTADTGFLPLSQPRTFRLSTAFKF
ncbi:TonB-dependent receptor [Paracoccus xiamenensis]|uniref:TonB-dependent receptor n=1 Tax=Paracoccus xiamenensis TaxID=2714901 RepID=UPI001F1C5DE1|nr:TonB-dependent receptor [Paracoccus xiamenensis]